MLQCIPRRYVIVILGLLSFAILNAQRVNITIALVAMTNLSAQTTSSSIESKNTSNATVKKIDNQINYNTFNWDSKTQGYIISSGFIGFFLTQLPGGRLAEILGAKQMMCFGLFCASLCNIVSPVAAVWNTYLFVAAQFVKGMAQGFIQPAVSCLMARWYPKEERSFLTSLTYSGFPAGALLGGVVSGMLCNTNILGGWPAVFYTFGLAGVILVLVEVFLVFNSPEEHDASNKLQLDIIFDEEVSDTKINIDTPWMKMMLSPATWALFAGLIGQYWMTFYFISVHPTYLSDVLNLDITQNGLFSSLPYILQIFVTWLGSSLSDWFIQNNYATTDTARKFCNTLSCLGFSVGMLGVIYSECSIIFNIVCFFIAMSFIGLGYPGCLTVPMDMTKDFAGTLVGLSGTIASISGFIIPVIVGYLTHNQGTFAQWSKVIYISIAVVMGSGIIFHLFGSAELQNWESKLECIRSEEIIKYPHSSDQDKTLKIVSSIS